MQQAVAGATQRFQRRTPSACQELMYMFDGDDNGVCHHAATSYGKQPWVNPVLSGLLKVCNDCMQWLYATAICNGYMQWLYAMAVCNGCVQ